MGGIESYWVRIAKWSKKHDETFYLALPDKKGGVQEEWSSEFKKLSIHTVQYAIRPFNGISLADEAIIDMNSIIVVPDVITYIGFCRWKSIKKRGDVSIVLYILNPNYSVFNTKKTYLNRPYDKTLRSQLGKSIIFMDEDCLERAEQFYKQRIDSSGIVRLGYEIEALDTNEIMQRRNDMQDFEVLSVSRFAFPFKGYQLGLIDAVPMLVERYPRIKFTIIGCDESTNGDELFKKKYDGLDEFQKQKVKWIKKVAYSDLVKHYHTANLYIGMGSTVIEAAVHGVPSIVVAYNTTDLAPIGYFHEMDGLIGRPFNKAIKPKEIAELIDKVYNASQSEYERLQINTYDEYAKKYDIDKVMQALESRKGMFARIPLTVSVYNAAIYYTLHFRDTIRRIFRTIRVGSSE